MKPQCPPEAGRARFPQIDHCFQSGMGKWHDFWSASGDEGASDRRRFYNFTREFLLASARERKAETVVFALVVVAAAWPVIYMVVTVIAVLTRGHPLDRQ